MKLSRYRVPLYQLPHVINHTLYTAGRLIDTLTSSIEINNMLVTYHNFYQYVPHLSS